MTKIIAQHPPKHYAIMHSGGRAGANMPFTDICFCWGNGPVLDDEILADPEVAKVIEENDGKVKMSMDIRSLFSCKIPAGFGGEVLIWCVFFSEEFTYWKDFLWAQLFFVGGGRQLLRKKELPSEVKQPFLMYTVCIKIWNRPTETTNKKRLFRVPGCYQTILLLINSLHQGIRTVPWVVVWLVPSLLAMAIMDLKVTGLNAVSWGELEGDKSLSLRNHS